MSEYFLSNYIFFITLFIFGCFIAVLHFLFIKGDKTEKKIESKKTTKKRRKK